MDGKKIGARIEQRRKNLGMTLDNIAQEIGVAKSTVQRYEKGTIEKIKLPVLESIARALDVNPAWLCFKSDQMEPVWYESPLPSGLTPSQRCVSGKFWALRPVESPSTGSCWMKLSWPRMISRLMWFSAVWVTV